MSDFDSKKMIAFLSEKWGERECPMCRQGQWSIQDKVFQLTEFHQGGMVIGGPVIPIVPVTCGNCGHTVLVNSIVAGLIEPEATPATEAAP